MGWAPDRHGTESLDWTIANTIAIKQKACETTLSECSKYFVGVSLMSSTGSGLTTEIMDLAR